MQALVCCLRCCCCQRCLLHVVADLLLKQQLHVLSRARAAESLCTWHGQLLHQSLQMLQLLLLLQLLLPEQLLVPLQLLL